MIKMKLNAFGLPIEEIVKNMWFTKHRPLNPKL